jgi:hypothetical protein
MLEDIIEIHFHEQRLKNLYAQVGLIHLADFFTTELHKPEKYQVGGWISTCLWTPTAAPAQVFASEFLSHWTAIVLPHRLSSQPRK